MKKRLAKWINSQFVTIDGAYLGVYKDSLRGNKKQLRKVPYLTSVKADKRMNKLFSTFGTYR